jgi:RHS repeat-associated protein
LTVTGGATFVYDGDGNRVKKTEGGQTVLYINQYYEKNITTSVVTTSYYLGGQLVATREGTTLRYVHQDSLGSTSTVSASDGTAISSIAYFPFGSTRTGSVNTDKKFTGQRLDSTGLYYYRTDAFNANGCSNLVPDSALTLSMLWGGRYYDPGIGRFISADTIIPDINNPQSLNRYSYAVNNPLKYEDVDGHFPLAIMMVGALVGSIVNTATYAIVNHGNVTTKGLITAAVTGAITGAVCSLAGPLGGTIAKGIEASLGLAGC